MGFDDRFGSFLLGCLIGLVVGYIVRLLQDTRKKIEEVDEHVQDAHHAPRDENGFMRHRIVADLMMLTVVCISVWAAITTQIVNNDLKATQDRLEYVGRCTQVTLNKTVVALNERTMYSSAQLQANVDLQKAQAEFLRILRHQPPYSDVRREAAAQAYFDALIRFIDLSKKQRATAAKNEFPTSEYFQACLERGGQ